jgi:hypothetical protein
MPKVEVEWEPVEHPNARKPPNVTPERGDEYVKVSYPAQGEIIYYCYSCLDHYSFVEIIDGEVMISEWHNAHCDALEYLRPLACHGSIPPGEYCETCGTYRHCHGKLAPGQSCETCGAMNDTCHRYRSLKPGEVCQVCGTINPNEE